MRLNMLKQTFEKQPPFLTFMPSTKLYMESIDACYLKEFTAQVTAVDETSVTLDQTLFYPLGGGQNWDTGKLTWDGGKYRLLK